MQRLGSSKSAENAPARAPLAAIWIRAATFILSFSPSLTATDSIGLPISRPIHFSNVEFRSFTQFRPIPRPPVTNHPNAEIWVHFFCYFTDTVTWMFCIYFSRALSGLSDRSYHSALLPPLARDRRSG